MRHTTNYWKACMQLFVRCPGWREGCEGRGRGVPERERERERERGRERERDCVCGCGWSRAHVICVMCAPPLFTCHITISPPPPHTNTTLARAPTLPFRTRSHSLPPSPISRPYPYKKQKPQRCTNTEVPEKDRPEAHIVKRHGGGGRRRAGGHLRK